MEWMNYNIIQNINTNCIEKNTTANTSNRCTTLEKDKK